MEQVTGVNDCVDVFFERAVDGGLESVCEVATTDVASILPVTEMCIAYMEELGHWYRSYRNLTTQGTITYANQSESNIQR